MNLAGEKSPLYVYDKSTLQSSAERILGLKAIDRINYAVKANSHPKLLSLFYSLGLSFDCVSIGEINHIRKVLPQIQGSRIIFTPNFAPIREYATAFELGCHVTIDNLMLLEAHPKVFAKRQFFLRLDPNIQAGHHKHVKTSGTQSKFGVAFDQLETLRSTDKKVDAKVIGLHAHVGSGIHASSTWATTANFLAELSKMFPDVKVLDLGGGFAVPDKPEQLPLDLAAVEKSLLEVKKLYPQFELWIEPGRYLVAAAGVLLTRVTQVKQKGDRIFVGVDTGMNSLIRYPLYGSYHQIVNLERHDEKAHASGYRRSDMRNRGCLGTCKIFTPDPRRRYHIGRYCRRLQQVYGLELQLERACH